MDLSKHMRFQSVRLVGAVGIEPTTFGLKGRCSTTELRPYLLSTSYIEKIYRALRRPKREVFLWASARTWYYNNALSISKENLDLISFPSTKPGVRQLHCHAVV
jgi:hypothetical protein